MEYAHKAAEAPSLFRWALKPKNQRIEIGWQLKEGHGADGK
jgi:hypothetical protein